MATPRFIRALGDVDGNGVGELAIASLRSSGRVRVDVFDGASAMRTSWARFLKAGFDPRDLEVVEDVSGNDIEELAVIGRDSLTGDVRIQLRDALSGERVRRIQLP